LVGRYGLNGKPDLTLAELGDNYEITRERVRQIESLALFNVKNRLGKGEITSFIGLALGYLKQFGGVRKEEDLLKDLSCSAADAHNVSFLLDVSRKSHYYGEDKDFYSYWYINADYKKRAIGFINRLISQMRKKRKETTNSKGGMPENLRDSVAVNYVSISKSFGRNSFGDFGLTEWPEVLPKNAKDWAYLVLKKNKKPLHFSEISQEIRKLRDKNRETNTQTVHNELIKDERFVLVGRGTYGLKEFGILPGTARDIIANFLKKRGPTGSRELIKLILQERMFQENTILINLQNKRYFKRLDDGRYNLRES